MNLNFIHKLMGVTLLSLISVTCNAQDLIARQAPVDRHMKNLNSVKIGKSYSSTVDLNNPANHIYTNWEHKNLRNAKGFVPSNARIDLRGFHMPTDSRKVTSKFGRRWGKNHEGLDIKVYVGDTIRAAFDGKVRIASYNAGGYGYYIVIRHPNGLETLYGHMSRLIADEDDIVKAGEPIGLGGNTGLSFGSHLHFETRICGRPIDPALMFDFPNQDVTGDFFVTRETYGTKGSAVEKTTNSLNPNEDNRDALASSRSLRNTENTVQSKENEESTNDNVAKAQEEKTVTSSTNNRARRKKAARKEATSYTVKNGDTFYDIAHRHGMTVGQLARLNGTTAQKLLHKGDKIRVK